MTLKVTTIESKAKYLNEAKFPLFELHLNPKTKLITIKVLSIPSFLENIKDIINQKLYHKTVTFFYQQNTKGPMEPV